MNRIYHRAGRVAAVLALLVGCGGSEEPGRVGAAAIYGEDDRVESFLHPNTALAAVAQQSVAAVVGPARIGYSASGEVTVTQEMLGMRHGLCSDESFVEQPTAAVCAATLIDSNLVLTAAECVRDDTECADTAFVFDYRYTDVFVLDRIDIDDVYRCRSIVDRSAPMPSGFSDEDVNYAIIELDRPAVDAVGIGVTNPRAFPTLRTAASSVAIASNVQTVSFSAGTPMKIDSEGYVLYSRPPLLDFFGTSNDIILAGLGSPGFDDTGTMIGFVQRIQTPSFETDGVAGCDRVNFEPMSGPTGGRTTELTYVHRAIEGLCATGYPSVLCGRTPMCGDGTCSGAEDSDSCSADCTAPSCGDGFCHPTEIMGGCPGDCPGTPPGPTGPPPEWTCDAASFDSGDGCHCECGAVDPDCVLEPLPAINCDPDIDVCNDMAMCETVASVEVPPEWDCRVSRYDAGDECDCDCGAPDPDCDRTDVTVIVRGCDDGAAMCVAGACVSPGADAGAPVESDAGVVTDPDPMEDGGCAVGRRSSPAGWLFALALLGVVARIRKRR